MAWTDSRIFEQSMLLTIGGLVASTTPPTSMTATGLLGDTVNVSLYNTTSTPDRTVALASSLYNTGVWITANEVTDANWAAGGRPLAGKTWALDTATTSLCFHATNLAGGGNVTVAGVFGCLVHDDTLTSTFVKQGICYNYFGGSQGVTAGTFTIIWATVGGTTAVFNVTV
jgi:hypothetical protein